MSRHLRLLDEEQHATWDKIVGESFDLWDNQSPFDPQWGSARRNTFPGE